MGSSGGWPSGSRAPPGAAPPRLSSLGGGVSRGRGDGRGRGQEAGARGQEHRGKSVRGHELRARRQEKRKDMKMGGVRMSGRRQGQGKDILENLIPG